MVFTSSVVPSISILPSCDQSQFSQPIEFLPDGANGQSRTTLQFAHMEGLSVQAKQQAKDLGLYIGGKDFGERTRLRGNTIQLCGFTAHASASARAGNRQ